MDTLQKVMNDTINSAFLQNNNNNNVDLKDLLINLVTQGSAFLIQLTIITALCFLVPYLLCLPIRVIAYFLQPRTPYTTSIHNYQRKVRYESIYMPSSLMDKRYTDMLRIFLTFAFILYGAYRVAQRFNADYVWLLSVFGVLNAVGISVSQSIINPLFSFFRINFYSALEPYELVTIDKERLVVVSICSTITIFKPQKARSNTDPRKVEFDENDETMIWYDNSKLFAFGCIERHGLISEGVKLKLDALLSTHQDVRLKYRQQYEEHDKKLMVQEHKQHSTTAFTIHPYQNSQQFASNNHHLLQFLRNNNKSTV